MIPLVKVAMPPRELLMPALEEVLYSGMIAEGEQVYRFERALCQTFGLNNLLATSSGTAALHMALMLAGVQPGDEVISTAMTAEPTNTVILQSGAVPCFADVEPDTGNLAVEAVEAAITSRTKAIMVVHYAGYPVDMTGMRSLADAHGLRLIEDCAHALGAFAHGLPVGSLGDYAIYSFQAIKHLTTVDGGALMLRNGDELTKARQMRWFGLSKGVPRTEVDIRVQGYKYNMNNVAATLGLQQLQYIQARIARHIENAEYYNQRFCGAREMRPAKVAAWSRPSYWLYTLLCADSEAVEARLQAAGVTASKLHRPNHLHTIFAPFRRPLPALDRFHAELLHIPCGWWVDDEQRERIANVVLQGDL